MSEAEPAADPASREQTPPQQKGTIDQRQEPRYDITGEAEVSVAGGSSLLRGSVVNLSASGCYIQTIATLRIAPGTLAEIHFRVDSPGMGRKLLRVQSEVRFYKPKVGLGFRFLHMDHPTRDIITAILAHLDPDSAR